MISKWKLWIFLCAYFLLFANWKRQPYIPKDLNDCFTELTRILPAAEIVKLRNIPESELIDYHLGLGMWIRNNWGLWGGSRLSRWFNAQGIYHPDDMSGIILTSFWRHLHEEQIGLKGQIGIYKSYWHLMGVDQKYW
jgi:hypothetical protein